MYSSKKESLDVVNYLSIASYRIDNVQDGMGCEDAEACIPAPISEKFRLNHIESS